MLRIIISAALALCGAAAAATGPAAAFDSDGGSLQHGEQLMPELGAAPELGAEARTLLEQLIGQVAELRGEVRSLRAGGLRSDERLAALETERLRTAESCERDRGAARNATAGLSRRVAALEQAITAECCDEPSEDCTGGYPQTCNAGCASLFLPFWDECRSALGKDSRDFEPAVALCEAASGGSLTLAEQLHVECSDGTAAADCVPECTEQVHGFLMLLNIEGEDSKLSCELHHGFYSWVGAAVRVFLTHMHLSSLSSLPAACFAL